jgi:SAM-dependent methyltransferase
MLAGDKPPAKSGTLMKDMDPLDLLAASDDEHRPDLENRVAFQWRDRQDSLAHQHATQRDDVVLRLLADASRRGTEPRGVLDVGCAYGNYALMLNAMLGRDQSIAIRGVDLYEPHLQYGAAFARQVPGYANCEFSRADITEGLPFEDGTFDAICLADVLEHIEKPVEALAELRRVAKPGASIIISTPLSTSPFKRLARRTNRLTRGFLYQRYYSGKGSELDAQGEPVMVVSAGHDHVSEMTLSELRQTAEAAGLTVTAIEPMSIMSGSKWFDAHPFVLAGIMLMEAAHRRLRRPSWGHSVVLELTRPSDAGARTHTPR